MDALGGLNDAVVEAKRAAGISAPHYLTLPRPRTLMDVLSQDETDAVAPAEMLSSALLGRQLRQSPGLAYMLSLAELLSAEHVIAAMPRYLRISY